MRKAESEMSSRVSNQAPNSAEPARIGAGLMQARSPTWRRAVSGSPWVIARKARPSPIGSTTRNKVTKAETAKSSGIGECPEFEVRYTLQQFRADFGSQTLASH